MDNADCLKNLTENIVKKQTDSIESIKNLSQAVDSVSSDISNLINSLLMVGNRQFAENRIQDDDSLTGDEQLAIDNQHVKNTTHNSQQSVELSLGSILTEALSLLPQQELVEDTYDYSEVVSNDVREEPQLEIVSDEPTDECIEVAETVHIPANDALARLRQELESKHGFAKKEPINLAETSETVVHDISYYSNISAGNDIKTPDEVMDESHNATINSARIHRGNNSGTGTGDTPPQHDQRANDNPKSSSKSMKDDDIDDSRSKQVRPIIDRARVTDILKKYSLYDDDEDDDEEDESSD